MKRLSFILAVFAICAMLLSGCGGGAANDEMLTRIETLEKGLEQNPDHAMADSVITLSDQWAALQPNDPERQVKATLHAAHALTVTKRTALAFDRYKQTLKQYRQAPGADEVAIAMATLCRTEKGSPAAAYTIYQAFPEAFPQSDKIAEAKSHIPPSLPPLSQRLDSMAVHVVNAKTGQLDSHTANNYIESCEMLALMLPQSAEAPTHLYKAGEVSRSIGDHNHAIEYYKEVYTTFPDHKRAAEALFMHAFTLDNDLKHYDEAKVLYETFLKKYPKDDFADDAQFLLQNLGKSEEEIFKALEQKVQ